MQTLDQQVAHRLTARGVRYTAGRQSVIAALNLADGPRSANELFSELELPLSSLYRSLAVLEEAGVLTPHHGVRGVTRYELAEWAAGHHHHVVCESCGAVDDVHLDPTHEAELERLVAHITRSLSFSPTGHALEVEGRCESCL
ncbi:MAG TPA: Fur family transcriptional regulator [Acidimicrobiia bacterium]|nr:Fur family transcriptional regulator [Acidimicrobiia bacterium]